MGQASEVQGIFVSFIGGALMTLRVLCNYLVTQAD